MIIIGQVVHSCVFRTSFPAGNNKASHRRIATGRAEFSICFYGKMIFFSTTPTTKSKMHS